MAQRYEADRRPAASTENLPAAPWHRGGLTIAILSICYLFSFADRQILGLLIELIRADLSLSDTQIGILAGLAFAILYTTAALPLSTLSDRWSRKRVIIAGVALWGAATSLCGFATSFAQLFLCRLGVGLGEAALTPSAYAIIGEQFTGRARTRAMSIFVVGGAAGASLAMLLGAAAITIATQFVFVLPIVGALSIWRTVLIGLGLATMLLVLPLMLLADHQPRAASARDAGTGFAGLAREIIVRWRAYAPLFLGVPLMNLGAYAASFAAPAMMIRRFGWNEVAAGFWLGGTQVVAGVLGALWFGFMTAGRPEKRDVLNTIAWTTLPAALLMLAVPHGGAASAVALLAVITFLTSAMSVLAPVALQGVAAHGSRARLSSLFLLVANLVGIGLGPLSVTLVSDYGFGDRAAIGSAMAIVSAVALASGALICVGFRRDYRKLAHQVDETSGVLPSVLLTARP